MATATFAGTYTQNGGEDYAAGTVAITPYGGPTVTVTLDATGSYSQAVTLVLTAPTGLWLTDAGVFVTSTPASGIQIIPPGGTVTSGRVRVVEAITGKPVVTSVHEVAAGGTINTGRDVGTVLGGTDAIPPGTYVAAAGPAQTVTTPLRFATTSGPVAIGAAAAPNYVDQLYIKGSGDLVKEPVVIDTPAGQIVDLLTCRVGGVIKFDVTSTGSVELNAITFVQGVGGGNGEISEPTGGAMKFTAGAQGNGNMVFDALAAGSHYYQYGGVTKWTSGATGPVYNNALTLWWKNSTGTAVEAIRGAADNTLALVSIGSGIKLWTAGFGTSLLLIQDSGIWTFKDDTRFTIGSTAGLRIGTATTQKLGFWNAAPVAQPAGIVDADGTLADITTKFNSLLGKMESMGLLAAA